MVLGDDLYCKMVFEDIDERIGAHSRHQPSLDLRSGIIGMMQDTELRVASFPMEVE